MNATDPIREEHRQLLHDVESLRMTADRLDDLAFEAAEKEVRARLEFLEGRVLAHARVEEEHLYPLVERLTGASEGTRGMTRDHREVAALAGQLERAAEEGDVRMMRRLLYGLYQLIRLHFAKEEEIYLPLLDERLSAEQARELVQILRGA